MAVGVRERSAFIAFWLLVCAAAMAGAAGAQPVFYTYPLAFNPAKAKLALEEKGIKYTEKKIDIFGGQSLEPWYLKLNPAGSAPMLVVGDESITESSDIIRWADKQGEPLGGSAVDRPFVEAWLQKVDAWDGNLFAAVNTGAAGVIKFSTQFKINVAKSHAKRNPDMAELYTKKIAALERVIAEPNDAAAVERNHKQLIVLLDEAEARLEARKFIGGDQYSAADAIFTPVLYRVNHVKIAKELTDPRPNVKRYYDELRLRPSYKKAFCIADSGVGTAKTVLPALGRIFIAKLTKKY